MKIKEYQSGGIVYTPFISSRGAAPNTATQTTSPSTKSDSKTDKESNAIQKEIMNVLKENGLENDVDDFLSKANSILKSARQLSSSSTFGGIEEEYSMSHLIGVLQLANSVKQNKGLYDDAVNNLKTEKSGGEIALTSNGEIYALSADDDGNYDLTTINPSEYYNNSDKYYALTNTQVLQLRRNDPSLTYRTNILGDIAGSIGMETVTKQIDETISKFGEVTRAEYIHHTGEKISQSVWDGMQILIGEGPEGYYKITTKSEKDNLDSALTYIWRKIDADGQKKLMAEAAIQGRDPKKHYGDLILSALHLQTSYEQTPDFDSELTKSAGIGADTGKESLTADPRVSRIARGDGIPQTVTIAPRVKDPVTKEVGLTTTGYNYGAFVDNSGNRITETMTLRTIMGEDPVFGAAVDLKHISFGNLELKQKDIDTIVVDPNHTTLSGVWMPYKNTGAGYVIDFSMVGKYKEVEEILKNSSDLSKLEITKILEDKGIDPNKLRWEVDNTGKIKYWLDTKYFITFSAYGNRALIDGLKDNGFFERLGEIGGTWKRGDALSNFSPSAFNEIVRYGRQNHNKNAPTIFERSFWKADDWDSWNAYEGNIFIAVDPEQASYFTDDQLISKSNKTSQIQRIQIARNQQNPIINATLPDE